jgi:hypothetical protein
MPYFLHTDVRESHVLWRVSANFKLILYMSSKNAFSRVISNNRQIITNTFLNSHVTYSFPQSGQMTSGVGRPTIQSKMNILAIPTCP